MDRSIPRYTNRPLPPYRFVPGRTPHPTRDPRGYDYQRRSRPERAAVWVPPEQWRQSLDYLYGCDLYNLSYWWEAHEAWEGLWRLAGPDTAQRTFLQALIQIAVCHLKLEMGVMTGVERLLARGTERLGLLLRAPRQGASGDAYMGLPVRVWLGALNDYYRGLSADVPVRIAHDPAKYPYILLSGYEAQPGAASGPVAG